VAAGLVGGVAVLWVYAPALYASTPVELGRAQAVALTRTGILTAGAALLALAGVLANLLEHRRATNLTHTRELAEQAETRRANDLTHTRELYTAAVGQLGSATIDVRLGGIYALERLARDRDSPHDQRPAVQRTVVEVLSAFARVHSTDPALRPPPPVTPEGADGRPEPAAAPAGPVRPAVDVHAAVTVLARLPVLDGIARADLTDADFTGPASLHHLHIPPGGSLAHADLSGADLTGTRMEGADLSGALLNAADLTGALLNEANLTGARLVGAVLALARLNKAHLAGADLTDARLGGIDFTDADLTDADLTRADLGVGKDPSARDPGFPREGATLTRALLKGASLVRADLFNAMLNEADLTDAGLLGADLTCATLRGAKLTGAVLHKANLTHTDLTQEQVDAARGDATTVLPKARTRPAHWPKEDYSWRIQFDL
jgi:hypothetical protein